MRHKRTNWLPVITEALEGSSFRVGQGIGNRGWEIWRGIHYVGLLVRHKTKDGRWMMTHNAILDDDACYTHTDVLRTVHDYLRACPI